MTEVIYSHTPSSTSSLANKHPGELMTWPRVYTFTALKPCCGTDSSSTRRKRRTGWKKKNKPKKNQGHYSVKWQRRSRLSNLLLEKRDKKKSPDGPPSSPQMGFILFCFDISASNPVNHQILIAFWQQAEMWGLNTDICPDNDKTKKHATSPWFERVETAGRSAISSSKDAPDSFRGFTEALSSGQPLPRLWHIWVMRFTSRPLDLVQKQSATAHTQCGIRSPLERRRVVLHYALDRCQFNALTWLSCLLFPHVHSQSYIHQL